MSNHYYEIQSSLDSRFGAKIWPEVIYKFGAGWHLKNIETNKPLSPKQLKEQAGEAVANELIDECNALLIRVED